MQGVAKVVAVTLVLLLLLAAGTGQLLGGGVLHPGCAKLTPKLVVPANQAFGRLGATREDFEVCAPDGVVLRGWKVRPREPNGDWVLLFHGVSDNRMGMLAYAEFLLRAGYGLVMIVTRSVSSKPPPGRSSSGQCAAQGTRPRSARLPQNSSNTCLPSTPAFMLPSEGRTIPCPQGEGIPECPSCYAASTRRSGGGRAGCPRRC